MYTACATPHGACAAPPRRAKTPARRTYPERPVHSFRPRAPARGVQSATSACSASITFAGRVRVASFEDVTPHPQNDRTRCLGRIASTRHPQPGTGRPKVRQHASARGVLRPRVRRSAASRDRRGRPGPPGPPPFMPRGKTHSCYRSRGAGGASPVDAAFSPVCHFTMHHQLHPFTRPPPAGAARGRTGVRGVPPVGYVTVCSSLVVLTNTEWQGRCRKQRKAGESRYRRPADRRSASHHDGTGRPPARVRVGHATTCSVAGRVLPAVHAGPKVGVGVGPGRAARPPFARSGPPSPSRSPRARATMRSTRSQARRLVAAVDADSTGSHPVRHPESGGLPRPVGVVDGRDVPSRPGRKAHNCHLSRGTDGVSPAGP